MKPKSYIISIWLPFTLLAGCNANKSRLTQFEYQGYGDTTLSVMYGQVFEKVNGTTIPLGKVQIDILNTNRESESDKDGFFSVGFEPGNYQVLFSKKNYQSLVLKNYQSISDRVSKAKIILKQGKGQEEVQLPN
jgi:hypothetical protein